MNTLTRSLGRLALTAAGAAASSSATATASSSSASRHVLRITRPRTATSTAAFSLLASARPRPSPLGAAAAFPSSRPSVALFVPLSSSGVRHKGNLAPRRVKYRKAHKGRVPVKIGGSIKGTTVQQGVYGIRVLEPARLTAKQLQSAETALKRRLKVIKGAQVFMRVFPDIPVCVKGNETRMGKGKGAFEYWACRAPVGRVIFEVGGPVEIRAEVAKEALRLASAKLPVRTEFVSLESNPRLGRILVERDDQPASAVIPGEPSSSASSTLLTAPPSSVLGQAAGRPAVAEVPLSQAGSPAGSGHL
ncbi:39S ribosomal protein L16, mitochondrial [Tilletia horrida]|uniref:39S ribosomal protein L16, mitochondrial n=1 Tax=Tilletia horrida TaxID=155126 RepID=A0AAN6GHK5_9BASI|nr:39S ribosomal protein L16, mitochondrial [Tilletia horrida]